MMTDDPGTPGPHAWEINIAAMGRYGRFGVESERPLLDINHGIGERLQLKYELPWVAVEEKGAPERSGLGNSSVGIKWRFVDTGEDGWQISTYPQVEFRNPGSSSARRGVTEEGTSVLLPFEFQRSFGANDVGFEIGHLFTSRGQDEWTGGVVLGHSLSERTQVMAEVHLDATESFSNSTTALNVGARAQVRSSGGVLVAVGSELHNALGQRATVFGYVGWQQTMR